MKLFSKLILLFSLLEIISSHSHYCYKASPATKSDDCSVDSISASDKSNDYVHCCFVEHKKGDRKECWALTSYQYENIGKFKKQQEEGYEYDYKIDCNSSYMQICLIMILSFILF